MYFKFYVDVHFSILVLIQQYISMAENTAMMAHMYKILPSSLKVPVRAHTKISLFTRVQSTKSLPLQQQSLHDLPYYSSSCCRLKFSHEALLCLHLKKDTITIHLLILASGEAYPPALTRLATEDEAADWNVVTWGQIPCTKSHNCHNVIQIRHSLHR